MRIRHFAAGRRRPATLVCAVLVLALTACSDNVSTGVNATTGAQRRVSAPSLDVQINALIDALYTGGPHTVLAARWANVKRQSMKNQTGRTQHVQLVDWIQRHAADIHP